MAGKNGKREAVKNPEIQNQTISKAEPKKPVPDIEVRIDRLVNRENSNLRAIASANIGGVFAVHGLKVVNSRNGLFVTMPANSYIDENAQVKYKDIFHAITADARNVLNEKVMHEYRQVIQSQKENAVSESVNQDDSEDESEDEAEREGQDMQQSM